MSMESDYKMIVYNTFFISFFICLLVAIACYATIKWRQVHLEAGYALKQIPTQELNWVKEDKGIK